MTPGFPFHHFYILNGKLSSKVQLFIIIHNYFNCIKTIPFALQNMNGVQETSHRLSDYYRSLQDLPFWLMKVKMKQWIKGKYQQKQIYMSFSSCKGKMQAGVKEESFFSASDVKSQHVGC